MGALWIIVGIIFLLTAAGGSWLTPKIFPLFLVAILIAAGLSIAGVFIG